MWKVCALTTAIIAVSVFEAVAQQQAIDQASLCAFEDDALRSQKSALAAVATETNPVRRDTAADEFNAHLQQIHEQRQRLFGTQHFENLAGELEHLQNLSDLRINGYEVHVWLHCRTTPINFEAFVVMPGQLTDASVESDLRLLRSSLGQVNGGNPVVIGGTIVRVPAIESYHPGIPGAGLGGITTYVVRITNIRKR